MICLQIPFPRLTRSTRVRQEVEKDEHYKPRGHEVLYSCLGGILFLFMILVALCQDNDKDNDVVIVHVPGTLSAVHHSATSIYW